jgi:O-antigen/teichoic acid export membrane protein
MKASTVVSPASVTPQILASVQPTEESPVLDVVPHVATTSIVVLLGSAFGNGLNYLFGLYLARALGPVEFGLYALAITVFNIAVLLSPLGMETAVLRFVSQEANAASTQSTILSALGVTAAFGTFLALTLAVFSNQLAGAFGKPELAHVLIVLAMGVPVVALSTVLLSSLQALGQIRSMVLIRNGLEPIGKFLLAGIAVTFGFGLSGVLGALVIVFFMSLMMSVRYVRRCTSVHLTDIAHDGPAAKAMLAFSMPLVISNLFGIIAPRSDILAIGAYGAASDVAVYAVASQTAAMLALILTAFETAIASTIGGLLAKRDIAKLKHVSKTASRWAFTLSFFVFVHLALFSGDVMRLFGPTFEAGAVCLVILAIGHLVSSAAVSSTGIILMSGHSKTILLNSSTLGLALIVSNIVLVPGLGIVGAACATSFCIAAASFVCAIQARKFSGVIPYSWEKLKPLCAGFMTIAVGYWAKAFVKPELMLAAVVVISALYLGLLWLMKLEPSDRTALADFRRRVMGLR